MAVVGKTFKFEVDFSEIDAMLSELPKAMGKTVVRNALKKAAKPIKDAAAEGAPGGIKKSMKIDDKRGGKRVKSKKAVYMFVGPTEPHAHLVEFGTGPRYHKSGKYVGKMPPNPFMRKAWDSMKDRAFEILKEELSNELMKAAKRLKTRAERGTLGKRAREFLSR
jgi:HK97 gp10 family phage protein